VENPWRIATLQNLAGAGLPAPTIKTFEAEGF